MLILLVTRSSRSLLRLLLPRSHALLISSLPRQLTSWAVLVTSSNLFGASAGLACRRNSILQLLVLSPRELTRVNDLVTALGALKGDRLRRVEIFCENFFWLRQLTGC